MSDKVFDYENRLEHQIFMPAEPVEICHHCGELGHHKIQTCAYCGKDGCKETMRYDRDYLEWFCDEECLCRIKEKENTKENK